MSLIGAEQLPALRVELADERLAQYPTAALVWLAAVPEWPVPLAELAGFPTGDPTEPVGALVDRFTAAGLVETGELLDDDGEVQRTFWLATSRRAEVSSYLQRSAGGSLRGQVDALAGQVLSALGPESALSTPALEQWKRVVETHLGDPSGLALMAAVDELVTDGRTQRALALVGAAEALGNLIGEPLISAARRAQWRVDRGYRQAADARTLRGYLPRPDIDDGLLELLDGRPSWALHLLGDGGVGKTMAVRDLASGAFARRHGLAPFPVARVDFDHLDPRYPERRPAELLIALAAELTGYTSSRDALYGMRRLEDAATAVHEALTDPAGPGAEPALFDETVRLFAAFADSLGEPVLLVLDTCEELAKLAVPGTPSRVIERTFQIIERLHRLTPRIRVLLAGRRSLLDGVPPSADGGLNPHDYLRVLPLGGFVRAQAEQFLATAGDIPIRTDLAAAVLDRCTGPDGEANPFDLSCYREWALAEPDLDPEVLRTAPGDPYVEQRIIARLTEVPVRDALPVAVELGRFSRAMLETTLARHKVDAVAGFAGLAMQEWVTAVTFTRDGRPDVIEVDEHLRTRLRAVIAADRERFPLDRPTLGRDLAALVDAAPSVEGLAIECVEAALRLLPLPAGAELWQRFETRIAEQDAWGWASQALPRVAAAEVERTGPDPAASGSIALGTLRARRVVRNSQAPLEEARQTLFAAIRATQAAATLRLAGRPGLLALWEDVSRTADRHPVADIGWVLAVRSWCGRLSLSSPNARRSRYLLHRLSERAPGGIPPDSALAAIEGTAEDSDSWQPLATLREWLCATGFPKITVAALLCQASIHLRQNDLAGARDAVHTALDATEESTAPAPWTDWVVPPRLRDRARLARVVLALKLGEPPDSLPLADWIAEATPHLDDVDSERLVSACLRLRLDWGLVEADTIRSAITAETYVPERRPVLYWHLQVETLCATASRALAALGDEEAAAKALRGRREKAVLSGQDPASISDCDAVLVDLSRVARTHLTTSIGKLAQEGDSRVADQARAVLLLVDGQESRRPGADDEGALGIALNTLEEALLGGEESLIRPLRWEAEMLARNAIGQPIAERDERWLALLLRAVVLLYHPEEPARELLSTLRQVSARRLARAALAEGELLALRIPARGVELLEFAMDRFAGCGDSLGADRAATLAVLAAARSGQFGDRLRAPSSGQRVNGWRAAGRVPDLGAGWTERVRLATEVASGSVTSLPVSHVASPELLVVPLIGFTGKVSAPSEPFGSVEWADPGSTPKVLPPGAPGPIPIQPTSPSPVPRVSARTLPRISEPPPSSGIPKLPSVRVPGLSSILRRFSRAARVQTLSQSRWSSTRVVTVVVSALLAGFVITALLPDPHGARPGDPAPSGGTKVTVTLVLVLTVTAALGWLVIRRYWLLRRFLDSVLWLQSRIKRRRFRQRTVVVDGMSLNWVSATAVLVNGAYHHGSFLGIQTWGLAVDPSGLEPIEGPGWNPVVALIGADARSGRPYLVVPLLLRIESGSSTELEQGDWEQRLGRVAPRVGGYRALYVRCCRRTYEIGQLMPGQDLYLTAPPAQYLGPRSLQPDGVMSGSAVPVRSWSVSVCVGTPVRITGGWRLRIVDQHSGPATGQFSVVSPSEPSSSSYQPPNRSSAPGEGLIGPDDLVRDTGMLGVLVADPVDGPPRPLGDLREGMSSLAVALREAGASAVLVLPPLPDDLVRRILRRICSDLAGKILDVPAGRVLDTVFGIRELIRAAEVEDTAESDVPHLDVLVYM